MTPRQVRRAAERSAQKQRTQSRKRALASSTPASHAFSDLPIPTRLPTCDQPSRNLSTGPCTARGQSEIVPETQFKTGLQTGRTRSSPAEDAPPAHRTARLATSRGNSSPPVRVKPNSSDLSCSTPPGASLAFPLSRNGHLCPRPDSIRRLNSQIVSPRSLHILALI